MPANLPPAYFEAEREYRTAKEPQAKLEALERMLRLMPHHKGTDHLRAELRTRIAKTTQEVERQHATGGRADLYTVHREGAGQVALVGLPNAGKSALLAALTSAEVKVADYPYTTQLPQPAMMPFEDIQVQIVDTPPLAPGGTPGWVRGLLRQADLLLLVTDLSADPLAELSAVQEELAAFRIRPLGPATGCSDDEALLSKNSLVVANKCDLPGASEIAELLALEWGNRLPLLTVSAETGEGLDGLRREIVTALEIVRVYAKPPGRPPDLKRPFVLRRGATVEDLADEVHHQVHDTLRYAVLWPQDRPSVRVARHYVLQDRDVIELHAG